VVGLISLGLVRVIVIRWNVDSGLCLLVLDRLVDRGGGLVLRRPVVVLPVVFTITFFLVAPTNLKIVSNVFSLIMARTEKCDFYDNRPIKYNMKL